MPILPASSRRISWGTVRRGIAATIAAAAPTAVVHNRWALRFDLQSTIAMLQSEADSEKIHSWMVSVKNPHPDIEKIGGTEFAYNLELRIWGLMGYDYGNDNSNSQDKFEDEVDDVIATLKANASAPVVFGLTNADGVQAIREVVVPTEFELDVFGFGEGYDVHVAQGLMNVKIVR